MEMGSCELDEEGEGGEEEGESEEEREEEN